MTLAICHLCSLHLHPPGAAHHQEGHRGAEQGCGPAFGGMGWAHRAPTTTQVHVDAGERTRGPLCRRPRPQGWPDLALEPATGARLAGCWCPQRLWRRSGRLAGDSAQRSRTSEALRHPLVPVEPSLRPRQHARLTGSTSRCPSGRTMGLQAWGWITDRVYLPRDAVHPSAMSI